MKEVSARINLHLVQLAYKSEVNHCSYSFPSNHLRVTPCFIYGLKLAERSAHWRAYQEGWLLILEESAGSLTILLDVEVPRFASLLIHSDIQ